MLVTEQGENRIITISAEVAQLPSEARAEPQVSVQGVEPSEIKIKTLPTEQGENRIITMSAEVAQLVEYLPSKQTVASSSLVFR